MQIFKSNIVKSAIIGIYSLLLISFVVVGLYLGSVILIPITLAILLAFILTPLVSELERLFGRIIAVILIIIMVTLAIGMISYVLGKELVQFTSNLTEYKTNFNTRISSFSQSTYIDELKNKFYGKVTSANKPLPQTFDYSQIVLNFVGFILGSFINIVFTTLLIIFLVSFILIEREDLRGRFIRLIGQERIGATTSAINDAGIRVAYYLRMLLFVNIIYGLCVAFGLNLLGIPNALLWGALSTILRFVPYVGVWIAAAIPITLSFAITSTWFLPFMTISLFVILEAVTSNIFEPWLYGTSTGVSATALIIAALFWTFLWGPIGLILSTPITVCLVVLGRHVPRLEFFSILLSDEEPLTIYEEFYHRLLVANMKEIMQLTDDYLKENSLTALYDQVLIPVIATAEIDIRKEKIDEEQLHVLHQNIEDLIEDLDTKVPVNKEKKTEQNELKDQQKDMILCVPVKAKRDELVGEMLTQLLKKNNYNVINLSATLKIEEIFEYIKNDNPKMIIISVISPSTIIQARYLTRMIHAKFPHLKIMIGLWNYLEKLDDIQETLLVAGSDTVVVTLEKAISYINSDFNR